MPHPARFSVEILSVFEEVLLNEYPDFMGRPILHDPWAGSGERLASLADRLGFYYSGTEIEPVFIAARGIREGDSTDASTYPDRRAFRPPFLILTSPVYPSGVADDHKINDASKRNTYRAFKKELLGVDTSLHPRNMGSRGYRSSARGSNSVKRREYWELANDSVKHWGNAEMVIVNVSDFLQKRKGQVEVEPVVEDWAELLDKHGWKNMVRIPVGTRRQRHGENGDVRADCEYVLIGKKQ